MTSSTFDIEDRWPELFGQLDVAPRRAVIRSLVAAWHEGWEPNRRDVADLIDYARGAINFAEYETRSVRLATQIAARHE